MQALPPVGHRTRGCRDARVREVAVLLRVQPARARSRRYPLYRPAQHATPPTPTIQIVQPPAKPLDVVKEHRSYCPYIVRSTPLLTFSFAMTSAATHGVSGTGTSAPSGSSPAQRVVSLPPTPVSILSRPLSRVSTSGGTPTPGTPTGTGEEETLTEGWRAVLSVVGRAGMGRRRRRKRSGLLGMEMQIANASVQEEEGNQTSGSLEQAASATGEDQTGADAAPMEEDESERHVDAMVESVKRGGVRHPTLYLSIPFPVSSSFVVAPFSPTSRSPRSLRSRCILCLTELAFSRESFSLSFRL